jgi:hypothetical protein
MRRALRRARWCLLTAGALGMATPVLGQSLRPGVAVAGPAVQVRHDNQPAGATDLQLQLEAVRVELGWLSDPRTFGYQLVAHPLAGTVEARGYVPNEAVKQHALAVARARAGCAVVDRLKVHPDLVQRTGGGSAEELRGAALVLLAEAFPEAAGGFVVQALPDGEVTVSGTVASLADKLAVSRRLRHLGACTCVANRLEVGTVARMPLREPAPVASAARGVQQTSWQLPDDQSWGQPSTPTPVAAPPRLDPVPKGHPAAVSWSDTGKPARPINWAPTTGVTQAVLKTDKPLPPLTQVRAEEPAPRKETAAPAGGYVSAGVILRKSSSADTAPQSAAGTKPAADPGAPYVSSGTMILAHHISQAASAVPTAALKRRVEAVCGLAAHDVEVVAQPGNKVEVRFRTGNATDTDRLTAKIVGLPEFGPYEVSFQVQLEH